MGTVSVQFILKSVRIRFNIHINLVYMNPKTDKMKTKPIYRTEIRIRWTPNSLFFPIKKCPFFYFGDFLVNHFFLKPSQGLQNREENRTLDLWITNNLRLSF